MLPFPITRTEIHQPRPPKIQRLKRKLLQTRAIYSRNPYVRRRIHPKNNRKNSHNFSKIFRFLRQFPRFCLQNPKSINVEPFQRLPNRRHRPIPHAPSLLQAQSRRSPRRTKTSKTVQSTHIQPRYPKNLRNSKRHKTIKNHYSLPPLPQNPSKQHQHKAIHLIPIPLMEQTRSNLHRRRNRKNL